MVYVAHPYGGKRRNKKKVEKVIRKLSKRGGTYVSPIHAFGYMYHQCDYNRGMAMCIDLLEVCDMLYVCEGWEYSKGCKIEMDYARKHGIPVVHI